MNEKCLDIGTIQAFLDGEGEPSDAFISICSRFLARQNRGG